MFILLNVDNFFYQKEYLQSFIKKFNWHLNVEKSN